MEAKEIIASVIGACLGIYVMASLIPNAITTLVSANTTGWGTAEKTLWGVLPIMAVLGMVVLPVAVATDKL